MVTMLWMTFQIDFLIWKLLLFIQVSVNLFLEVQLTMNWQINLNNGMVPDMQQAIV